MQATTLWTYDDALAWLYKRQALGIKLGLEKVERLLDGLGNPHHEFRAVHVAGTNGKGSVTRMMAEALRRSGYHVGCTTSPHLVSFTERVEIDGLAITQREVAAGLHRIRPIVESLDAQGMHATFFEVVTALAFLHFAANEVAWAVVETGMGGRLDATNVLNPALTIITNVELDHQKHLGNTVTDIAWEKAGIMKPGTPCVTAAYGPALFVLKARSHDLQAPMSVIGEDYRVVPDADGLGLLRPTGESHYRIGLAGQHQRTNGAVVVAGVEALRRLGVAIPETALRAALASTVNPGRLETFHVTAGDLAPGSSPRPVVVLIDGAHNVAAARALQAHLEEVDWRGVDLVAGFCADKDWRDAVDLWLPHAARVWAVPVRNPRSLDPAALADHIGANAPVTVHADAASAIGAAVASGATRILVAGSLFLAGEARALLTQHSLEEIRGSQ